MSHQALFDPFAAWEKGLAATRQCILRKPAFQVAKPKQSARQKRVSNVLLTNGIKSHSPPHASVTINIDLPGGETKTQPAQ
jgi:hypothetical protein